jgi:sulfonate transport system permease protein
MKNSLLPAFRDPNAWLTGEALWTQSVTGPARADLSSSLEHLVAGYAIACVAGIGLGLALRYARVATSPYLYFLYVLPAPVLVPVAMTLFGIGFSMKVVLIAFAAMWHWHYGARAVAGGTR